jgi:hypothetical protein
MVGLHQHPHPCGVGASRQDKQRPRTCAVDAGERAADVQMTVGTGVNDRAGVCPGDPDRSLPGADFH